MTTIIECHPTAAGTPAPDLKAVKARQQAAWSSGDYAVIGTTLQIVGEELAEAMDLRAGQKVLDIAAGNGNATLAAARRWCEVTSTDYVEPLLSRGRKRAEAEGLQVKFQFADAEDLPFADTSFDAVVSSFGAMFCPGPGPHRCRNGAGVQVRRTHRPRQLDAGKLRRQPVQDHREIPAASERREVAGDLGNARLGGGDLRSRRIEG